MEEDKIIYGYIQTRYDYWVTTTIKGLQYDFNNKAWILDNDSVT